MDDQWVPVRRPARPYLSSRSDFVMTSCRLPFIKQFLYGVFLPLWLSGIVAANTVAAAAVMDGVEHQEITIWSGGVRLAGDIYTPAGMTPGEKLPGILLVHGWGGVKANLTRDRAPRFAAKGFVVLVFDYKGWGESNGPVWVEKELPATEELAEVEVKGKHIRKVISPRSMLQDARAALNFLAGDPRVLPGNIGIWGTSLGGGLSLVIAASDDRIRAFVDQIGAVNFKANLSMINDDMVRRWEIQRARGVIAPFPGQESVIDPALKGYPDWIHLKQFDSFASAPQLDVPTLIIDAEDEELFAREVNGQLLYTEIKDRVPSNYLVLPGKHYDMYSGENYETAQVAAQDWFVEHLKGDQKGAALYKEHCASCHSSADVSAQSLSSLRNMSYDKHMYSMTQGRMKTHSEKMSDEQRQRLAKYLTQGSKDPRAWEATMACEKGAVIDPAMEPSVAGWGYGPRNQRYQGAARAGITAADLPGLRLAWSMGFPGVTEMRSQPVITEHSLFLGVEGTGTVYAFELASGCLQWVYRSKAPVRSSIGFGRMPDSAAPILFFGDASGSVHVVSATDGSSIWSVPANVTDFNTITGTPVLHQDRLYVPISSFEVARARIGTYTCCKNHGGVRALDIRTGKSLWSYDTTGPAQPHGENRIGAQAWGPSGAPVWTTPAIDVKRNLLYIGTGQNYSYPTTQTSDAIIALDLDSGAVAWIHQALANDAYTSACFSYLGYPDQPNCPRDSGPDFDFGASVVIATTADGKDILLAGQKSGDVWALDPDNKGAVIWRTKLSDGTPVGGVHWGMTVMGDTVFVPVGDPDWDIKTWDYEARPGLTALDIASGEIRWQHRARRGCELDPAITNMVNGRQQEPWPDCPYMYGFSQATTGIDGAVLAGALDGKLKAFDPLKGEVLWQYDTKRSFDTLNGVEAHGGALDNAGPAVGDGYLVLQSGYNYFNQMPGNVLLVFKAG